MRSLVVHVGRRRRCVTDAQQERLPSHDMPIQGIDGRRVNLYQYFTVFGDGFLHLLELQHIG